MKNYIQLDFEAQKIKLEVLDCLAKGNLDLAETKLSQLDNKQSGIWYYLNGMLSLSRADYANAVSQLKRAREFSPEDTVVLSNLGIALQKNQQIEEAVAFFQEALEKDKDCLNAKYNLLCAHIEQERFESALELSNQLCHEDKGNVEYLCARADVLRLMNHWPQAYRQYLRVIRNNPEHFRTNINLAPIALHMGRVEKAIAYCKKALEINSKNAGAYKTLGDALLANEELDDAMDAYADAFELDPENENLCIAIARVWHEVDNLQEASFWFERALTINQESLAAKSGLARISQDLGNNLEVIGSIVPLLEDNDEHLELRMTLSDAYWEEGDAESAIEQLRRVLEIQPNRVATHAKIGQLLSSAGDVDAAIEEYKIALSQQKNNVAALNGMANTLRGKLEPELAERMEKILSRPKLREGVKSSLHNGLGFYYDGIKEYEKAAKHFSMSNEFQWSSRSKRGWEYDIERQQENVTNMIKVFNKDFMKQSSDWGVDNETPVFIVAMPRSGTTLTEQILARHEKVLGIGERNFASQSFRSIVLTPQGEQLQRVHLLNKKQVQSIGRQYLQILYHEKAKAARVEAVRVVDKMPDNYSLIGWIALLFPKARIIHINRDHRDVALSSWMTQFGSIRWACKPEHLVERFRQYRRIMDHWRETIPERFIEINYEDLVANQEDESKALIDYLGLDWDESCLKFYESDNLVKTASVTQVRQPIYTRSVAKWKYYEGLIPELFNPLTEMIEQ